MKTVVALTSVLLLVGAAPLAVAQDATQPQTTPSPAVTAQGPASPAQLKREHDRAIAAGDHANDPSNPASSNTLNQQELAKAQSLGTGPVPTTQSAAQDTQPVMAPSPGPAPQTPAAQPTSPSGN